MAVEGDRYFLLLPLGGINIVSTPLGNAQSISLPLFDVDIPIQVRLNSYCICISKGCG